MILGGYSVTALGEALDGRFFPTLGASGIPAWFARVTIPNLDSDQAEEKYGWLNYAPSLVEFKGEVAVSRLPSEQYTLPNIDFARGIEITHAEARRQKFGMFDRRVAELAARASRFPVKLFFQRLLDGESAVGYDGVAFFSGSHPTGGGTQDNDVTFNVGTPTAPTAAELADAVLSAIEAMHGFTDAEGEPINEELTEFHVLVPPNMMGAAAKAFSAQVIQGSGGAIDNVLTAVNGMQLSFVASARMATWNDKIVVLGPGNGVAPFIWQQETPVQTSIVDEELKKRLIYTASMAGNVGYGYWQQAVRVTLS
jgi:phage major head subunit gpT-like protein